MDDSRKQRRYVAPPIQRASYAAIQPPPVPHQISPPTASRPPTVTVRLRLPHFKRWNGWRRLRQSLRNIWIRSALVFMAVIILFAELFGIVQPHLIAHSYALGAGEALLQPKDSFLASKLKSNDQTSSYDYNAGYKPTNATTDAASGGPQISAVISKDPAKGLQVTDPTSSTTVTITPQFDLLNGKQDGNRVVYPLENGTGWLIYTAQASGIKEDVVLRSANGDTMKLKYKLDLDSQGLAARVQPDGSVGVYGSSLPIGSNVTTGSDKDADLLQKARQHAKKDKFLFDLPAPTVYQSDHVISKTVHSHYQLDGQYLTTVTTGLKAKGTSYPLDVDPAVTVIGTSDLFRDTNPDSNIDLNATSGGINRGEVTGGTVPAFTANASSLATKRSFGATAIYDDYAYVAGGAGSNSTTNLSTIEYAKMGSANSTDYTIGNWATTTNLPASLALSRFQILVYNGYMYVLGGATGTTDCSTVSSGIYYNRIQTNGQLSATWTTSSVNLPAGVCGLSATANSGSLYIAGGRTGSATSTGVTTVAHATFQPDGSISSFTNDTVLPAARYDADIRIYNGYVYIIGGMLGASPTNSILFAALNSSNAVYGSWATAANSFTTPRANFGSSFTAVSDGYMYLSGGCSAFSSQSCSTITSDTQIAQINADGTIGSWSNDSQAPLSRVGASLFAWRGTIYSLTGCTAMNAAISCTTAGSLATQQYSHITDAGQIGPLNTASNNFTPARYEHASALVNGYIYVIGGCIGTGGTPSYDCQTSTTSTTATTYYAPISASGSVGTWTLDSHTGFNTANNGGAAMGVAVYNNYIYLINGYTYNQGAYSAAYYAQSTATGALAAAWATTTNAPTTTKYGVSSFAYKGYIYAIGGCSNAAQATGCSTTSYSATVQRALYCTGSNNGTAGCTATVGNLGTWAVTGQTQLPAGRALAGVTTYNGYVYLAGGGTQANSGQDANVLYNTLTASGITGTWKTATGSMTWTDGSTALKLRRTDAYAMNGYLYVTGGHDGETGTQFGTYGTVQIGKIDMSTGNILSNLLPSVTTLTPRWDARTVFANGYMYVTGGCITGNPPASCTAASNLTEYVEIYNAGNKGTSAWANSSHTPVADGVSGAVNLTNTASVAFNGYLYIVGGCNSFTIATTNNCAAVGNIQNTVYYAQLLPDGSIGSWASGGTLGTAVMDSCLVAVGGYLYNLGGRTAPGTATSVVSESQIGTNGLPGTWTTSSAALGGAAGELGCGVFNGHIYITGGATNAGAAKTTLAYTSSDLSSGGAIPSGTWVTSATVLAPARAGHATVIAGGYLYVIGGNSGNVTGNFTGAVLLQDVQYIQLVPSGGTTGSWTASVDLPLPVQQITAFAANGYIYVTGGRTANTTCSANTWIASVNSTGTVSQWSQAINKITTARFGAGSAYYDGYYYTLGGDDCTSIISSNVMQYGGEQSQAMIAQFSKYADLNGNGRPQKLVIYLTNAQLNSVDIEKWKLNYISSFDNGSTPSWGTNTSISPLLNQNAYSVNAYDGTGTDLKLSRWFYLSFSIDMTTSFTFADDTQPAISQYGLHYSPPPSKRLLHGRDFRDQTQQGEDLKL